MDDNDEILKAIEGRKNTVGGFLRKVDRRVLVACLAAVSVFVYLYQTGGITKQAVWLMVGISAVLIFVLGAREKTIDVIPIDEIMVLLKEKMERVAALAGLDNTEIKLGTSFVLYHKNWMPMSYDIAYQIVTDKKGKTFVAEIEATKGYLVKNREAPAGWNADKPTNTVFDVRYVPDSKLLDLGSNKQQ